jgi:hypothetical protein
VRRKVAPGPAPSQHAVRRRWLLALAGLGVVLALASASWLALSGSGTPPPATGAATLVPADALAYVNLSTDPARPAVRQARALAARFPDWPLLEAVALNRLTALLAGQRSAGYAADIRPWLGHEAALAVLPAAGSSTRTLIVLEVTRRARARTFLTSEGATPAGSYRGVPLLASRSGTELAFVGRYLVAGPAAGVDAAVAAARGQARSLAHNPGYERAAAGEPDDRVLDAYLPAAGITRLLASRTGMAGALGLLLDRPGVEGTAISLSPQAGGARVVIHSVLSASAAGANGSHSGSFTPTLQSVLPSGSTLMLDVHGLGAAAPELLQAAAVARIAANVGPLLRRLGSALASEGVNLRNVISIFGGETAVALSPGPAPALLIVARVHNQAAARTELATLEAPLTALFSPAGSNALQAPEISDHQVGDATIHELQLGPGLQLDYGVFNGLVAVSTSVEAIDAVAQRSRSLADDATYKATLPSQPQQVSSLVFLDFSRLLRLGEQMGLTSGSRIRELLPDLSKVRAIGLRSTRGSDGTSTELTLEIP